MKKENIFKVGDVVRVRKGVMDPDFEDRCIEDWQGVIYLTQEDPDLVGIEWDSFTLDQMPDSIIKQSQEENLDYTRILLKPDDVITAESRDSPEDVERVRERIERDTHWLFLGEEGERIQEILYNIDPEDYGASFKAWEAYFEKTLSFPFEAVVSEYQDQGPLRAGDKVLVQKIGLVDDLYGIIVDIEGGAFPLCDLRALDKDSPNFQPLRDYAMWFANH